jgi:hypothetical protein
MDLDKFEQKHTYLYHLTDQRNYEIIRENHRLLSTKEILNLSSYSENERKILLRTRRPVHLSINVNGSTYYIRDQRPISIVNLTKCLTNGWTTEDFIELLNNRVFFWANIKRLRSHYKRYISENPMIIRVLTQDILALNPNVEFCRLNSGATRSNTYWNGAPPPRGEETFLFADRFVYPESQVAEVTFPDLCQLPEIFSIGKAPEGPWTIVNHK